MTEYSGVVQRTFQKPFGNKLFHSFTIGGTDGFFGTGLKRPPAEGTSIRFNANKNAKGYLEVDVGSINELTDGAAGPTPSPTKSVGSAKTDFQLREKYWGDKEQRDIRNDYLREVGASRNTAIAIIDLMVKLEAIKLPAAGPKKEAFIWELIERYKSQLMATSTPAKPEATAEPEVVVDESEEEEEWS